MERLTEHYGDHIRVKGNSSIYANKERKSAYLCNAIVRLAAYEDSGLSPDEIPLWIDAESEMPDIGQTVLAYLPDKSKDKIRIAEYLGEGDYRILKRVYRGCEIGAWMLLSAAPKEEK
mgnify:CR=1 FL=1